MTKEEWIKTRQFLEEIQSEFLLSYPDYRNGRNKQIRENAVRRVDSAIYCADNLVTSNNDVYSLLTGCKNVMGFGRVISYDEFKQPRYFGGDLSTLIARINDEIEKCPLIHRLSCGRHASA
jgi:hypothetical protein